MSNRKAVNYEALLLASTRIKIQVPKAHRDMHVYEVGERLAGKGVVQVGELLYRQDIAALVALSPTIAHLVGNRKIHHFNNARPLVIPGISNADFENWLLVHIPTYDCVQEGIRIVRKRRLLKDYASFQRASAILRSTITPSLRPLIDCRPPPLPPKDRHYIPIAYPQLSKSPSTSTNGSNRFRGG